MVTQQMVDELRTFDGRDYPVLSLYLGLPPGADARRSLAARLKDLLQPVRQLGETLPREQAKSLRGDVTSVLGMESRLAAELGHGLAVFSSSGNGFLEYTTLPLRVRDRAVVDDSPYVRPLDAVLEESARYCAVVLDKRRAEIFHFYMGELELWEQRNEEELRKSNFGGFAGYDERRVRTHAAEVASRHYRDAAGRLLELHRDPGFDLLLIGGQHENVDGLVGVLHPQVAATLAGTFTIDTHTSTPALVLEHCRALAARHDAAAKSELVDQIIDTAKGGGLAILGLEDAVAAANQRAVETLAVDTRFSVPGERCSSCGWLALDGEGSCPACGNATRRIPDLIDAVAIAVRSAGGTVKHVLHESPLAGYQVGAKVRFAPALQP